MSAMNCGATRRAVVAGLAAAPAAGLPVVSAAAMSDDPIFNSFTEFERTKAAAAQSWKASEDLREVTVRALDAAGVKPTKILTRRRLEIHRECGLLSDSEYAEALIALDGLESEHQKMWRAVEDLDDSAWAAAEARGEAERELLTTAPQTRAGALRLLRHLAEFLSDDDVVNDLYVDDVVGDALRNAIAVFEREVRS